MKFKIYHSNGNTKIITAKDLNEAEKRADKIWKNWLDIRIIDFYKSRKSITLNKRQNVQQSKKVYNRNDMKKELKRQIQDDLM